jgi:alpha-L-rhamnosidase
MRIIDLRTERLREPLGLMCPRPRLSWRLEASGGETNVVQSAYEVEVGHNDEVTWRTGHVEGRDQSVTYAGPHLPSRAKRWWRIRADTSAGNTEWSDRATFEVGMMDPGDWRAAMIIAGVETPVVRFTKRFAASEGVARLYATAYGAFVVRLNGSDVGDEVLAPGWTSYNRRLAVRTFDVTDLIRAGENELEALVAPAWFSGRFGLNEPKEGFWGRDVGLFMQVEVDRHVVVATDTSWQASATAYLEAQIYDGETYDARRDGASTSGAPVTTIDVRTATFVAPPVPAVRRTEVVRPVERRMIADGVEQFDFGQNVVGFLRLRIRGAQAVDHIVMRHAEVLGPDGRLFTEPLRSAKASDTYIARGDALEAYEPRFTFHGFRYAEIETCGADIGVEAVVIHSDLERIGTFECSDPLVNQLYANVVWGWRGNSVSVPTDCPQRDERLGWTGDAQVFSPTASFLYDCETFWENWLADLAVDQREDGCVPPVIPDMNFRLGDGAAGWGDAATVVPMTTYEAYGDTSILETQIDSMVKWNDYVYSRLDDNLRWRQDFQFGDWLDPDAPTAEPWKAKARSDLVATAYAVRSSDLVARALEILGRDASTYRDRASSIRAAWYEHFGDSACTTQTACALALEFDLVPLTERERYGDALVRLVRDAGNHLATGFLGTPLLLPALTHTGHLDVAYDVLLQRTCPSWLYQVVAGGTTIWERWDALREDGSVPTDALGGASQGMVSFNHYAYGAVAEWLHRTVAGLSFDRDEPGYRHIIVQPRPGGGITEASASLDTRYGRAGVAWCLVENDQIHVSVEVPPNTSATVHLPGQGPTIVGSGRWSFRARTEPSETS